MLPCSIKLIGNELDEARIKKIKEKISKEIDEAFDYARQSPFPSIELLNQHIYKN